MTSTTKLLPCVEIEPAAPARFSVIWLHGLGADGNDFVPAVPLLGLPASTPVRFVFPHAPQIPLTVNAGMVMPAWYDISNVDLRARHDEVGIRRSAAAVEALIARENERGVPSRNVALFGFSQGGAMATFVALRHAQPLRCLAALSTYLVLPEKLDAETSAANRAIEVFQAHGTQDGVVRHERGVALRDALIERGVSVTWKSYPMAHEVCREELEALGSWLAARLR